MAQDLGGLRRSAAEVRAEERGTRHSGAQPQSDPEILGLKGNHQADGPTDPVVVRDLVRAYGDAPVLDHLDLRIAPGEFVAILGRSGSGKSTLLRALAGLDRDVPGTGEITVPRSVSVVFQDSRLLPWARVLDNVVLGLEASTGLSRAEARRALRHATGG